MESESSDIDSDLSIGKLRELIRVESKSHEDTGRCYDTLQNEYAELLEKYAVAQETIERLRRDNLKPDESKEEYDRNTEEIGVVLKDGDIDKCLHDSLYSQTRKLQSIVAKFHTRLSKQRYTGNELIKIFKRLHADFESIVKTYRAMHGDECLDSNDEQLDKLMTTDDLIASCPLEETRDTRLNGNTSTNVARTCLTVPTYKMNNETGLMNHNIGEDVKSIYSQISDNTSIVTSETNMIDNLLGLDMDFLFEPSSKPDNLSGQKGGNDAPSISYLCHEYPLWGRDEALNPQDGDESSLNVAYVKEEGDESLRKSTVDTLNNLILRRPSSRKDMSIFKFSNHLALDHTKDSGYFEDSQSHHSSYLSNDARYPLTNRSLLSYEKSKLKKREDSVRDESSSNHNKQSIKHLESCLTNFNRAINNSSSISLVASHCTDKDQRSIAYNEKGIRRKSQNSSNCSSITSKEKEIHEIKNTDVSLAESFLTSNKKGERNCQKVSKEVEPIEQNDQMLRNDTNGLREVVTSLKDSFYSNFCKSSKIMPCTDLNRHAILQSNDDCDEVVDSPAYKEFDQVLQLYAKGNEILRRLERKSCDIADRVKSVIPNQEQISFSSSLHVDANNNNSYQHKNRSRNKRSNKHQSRRLANTTLNSGKSPMEKVPRNGKRSAHSSLSQKIYSNHDAHELKHSCICEGIVYGDEMKQSYNFVDSGNADKYLTENQHSISKKNGDEFDDFSSNIFSGAKAPYKENLKRCSFKKGKCVLSLARCTCLPDGCDISHCDGMDQNTCLHTAVNNRLMQEREDKSTSFDHLGEIQNTCGEYEKKSEKTCNINIKRSGSALRGKLPQLIEQINQFSSRSQGNKIEKKDSIRGSHGSIINDINNRLDNLSLLIAERDSLNSRASKEGIDSPGSARRVAHPIYLSNGNEYKNDSDIFNGHFLPASPEKQITAPIVHHHYHTVVRAPLEPTARQEDKSRRAIRHNEDTSTKRMIEYQSPYSLEKANILASYINTLSENMTRRIANDLFYSGPSEC